MDCIEKKRVNPLHLVISNPRSRLRFDIYTPGGSCNEGQKARPNIDVTMDIEGRVVQPDGKGNVFIDTPSLEIRFGSPKAIRFVRGLESGLTGACVDEERTLLLGPNLAYGEQGKSDG